MSCKICLRKWHLKLMWSNFYLKFSCEINSHEIHANCINVWWLVLLELTVCYSILVLNNIPSLLSLWIFFMSWTTDIFKILWKSGILLSRWGQCGYIKKHYFASTGNVILFSISKKLLLCIQILKPISWECINLWSVISTNTELPWTLRIPWYMLYIL